MIGRRGLLTSLTAGASLLILEGCATLDPTGASPVPEQVEFEALVDQIKYDVGTYMWMHRNDRESILPPPENATPAEITEYEGILQSGTYRAADPNVVCVGQVSFQIVKVKLVVSTVREVKANGSISFIVPLGPVALTPSLSGGVVQSQGMTTTLEILPTFQGLEREMVDSEPVPPEGSFGHPIADTLDALGNALVATSDVKPCFNFGLPQDQKVNSVKFGFTVTRTVVAGIAKFSLVIFSVGADTSQMASDVNTIEMFFVSRGDLG